MQNQINGSFLITFLLAFYSALAPAAEADFALLKELVNINSGSRNIPGVKAVQDRVATELEAMGFSIQRIENPLGDQVSAPLLLGVLKGKNTEKYLTVITHADTVFEPTSGFLNYSESEDGKYLLGPGVGDDKGGIVVALMGLRELLKQHKMLPFSVRFAIAPSEEIGSKGFQEIFKSFGKDSILALGFEDAGLNGAIAESRSGILTYDIQVTGKEAHSGTNHHNGINACVELAQKLVELSKLTNYKSKTTVNVANFSGGTEKTNIVCPSAHAKVEARYKTPEASAELEKKMEAILKRVFVRSAKDQIPSETKFTLTRGHPSFPPYAISKRYTKKYTEIISKLEGREVKAIHMGGGADISYLASPTLIAFDDVGPCSSGAHTKEERVLKSTIITRSTGFVEFMNWFFKN